MSYYLMTQNQLQDYCKIQDELHVMGENGYYTIRENPAEKIDQQLNSREWRGKDFAFLSSHAREVVKNAYLEVEQPLTQHLATIHTAISKTKKNVISEVF